MTTALNAIPASRSKPRADYLALVVKFPLRAIHSAAHHEAASLALERLVGRDDLTPGQAEYLDALATLVEAFETRRDAGGDDAAEPVAPLDMLRALMEHRGMRQADLAKLLGSEPAASMLLAGKRPISRAQARRLADHFRVDVGVFL